MFQVAKAVSHSLNNCVNCLPGQKDVDMALRSIGEASKKLLVDAVSLTLWTWKHEKHINNLYNLYTNDLVICTHS